MTVHSDYWRVCSSCKKPLAYQSKYYECSVSTCTRKRTGYVFCSVPCWERHLPGARHRDAGAIEKIAPTQQQWAQECAAEEVKEESSVKPPQRYIASSSMQPQQTSANPSMNLGKATSAMQDEVLVVVSKMKQYVKDMADMNTSADVATILSHMIRKACDQAIDHARQDGRKTIMARDFHQK